MLFNLKFSFHTILSDQPDEGARCFLGLVSKDMELRWGGEFNEPSYDVIDDGLNLKNKKKWEKLYYDMQSLCS